MNSSTTRSDALQSCLTNTFSQKVVKTIAYGLIALIGLLGNLLICFIFCKSKNLRRTINYFIFNMAVSDLLVPIFAVPRKIKDQFTTIPGRWFISGAPGTVLCITSYFAQDVSFVVSILSLLFMAFERFVAVVFPMKASAVIGTKSRMALIALTWTAAIAVHASYFYTFRLTKNENNVTLCTTTWEPALDHRSTQRRYGIATFVMFVMVPFGLLLIFYTSIAIALRKQNTSLGNSTREGIPERVRREKENRAVTILSAVVVGGFVICCAPMNTYVFVQIFGLNGLETMPNCDYLTFYFVADFLVRASTVVNPCTCFVFYRSYRRSLGELFHSFSQLFSKPCSARPAESLPPSPIELREIRAERNIMRSRHIYRL